jgi:hypothetical protein
VWPLWRGNELRRDFNELPGRCLGEENLKPSSVLSLLLHCFSVELATEALSNLMYRGLGGSKGSTGKQGNRTHSDAKCSIVES